LGVSVAALDLLVCHLSTGSFLFPSIEHFDVRRKSEPRLTVSLVGDTVNQPSPLPRGSISSEARMVAEACANPQRRHRRPTGSLWVVKAG